jgi:hypothetical protein
MGTFHLRHFDNGSDDLTDDLMNLRKKLRKVRLDNVKARFEIVRLCKPGAWLDPALESTDKMNQTQT